MAEVLIVGAGPTGLVLALELARYGIKFRLIDQKTGPADHSQALALHARSMEVFHDMGLSDALISQGRMIQRMTVHLASNKEINLNLQNLETLFPFVLALPQNQTERILIQHLEDLGHSVEWKTSLEDLIAKGDKVLVTLSSDGKKREKAEFDWLVGCDGAHSTVRKSLNLSFHGAAYPEELLLADVRLSGSMFEEQGHIFLQDHGLLAAIPTGERDFVRLITFANHKKSPKASLAYLQSLVDAFFPEKTEILESLWASEFHIHRRKVDHLRWGRVFLAGDAAHIHSPVGGQGMNTGIQDAYNLGWKLAKVIQNRSSKDLLQTYEEERLPIAEKVLAGTNQATRMVFSQKPLHRFVRNYVAPWAFKIPFVHHKVLQNISELGIRYEKPSLGRCAGFFQKKPGAGYRAPSGQVLDIHGKSTFLHDLMRGTHFTLLDFSLEPHNISLHPDIKVINISRKQHPFSHIPSFQDPVGNVTQSYNAEPGTLILVRPDGYIACRGSFRELKELKQYVERILR